MDEANEHNEERPCVSQKYSSRTKKKIDEEEATTVEGS